MCVGCHGRASSATSGDGIAIVERFKHETADVDLDNQTPVAQGSGYGPEETRFTGKIHEVVVTLE